MIYTLKQKIIDNIIVFMLVMSTGGLLFVFNRNLMYIIFTSFLFGALFFSRKKINKKNVIVDYAMRYGSPSIKSKLSEFKEKGCDRIIILSLYPQYSGPTTATVNDEVCKWMLSQKWQPSIRIASPYFDAPEYINSISKSILNSFKNAILNPWIAYLKLRGMFLLFIINYKIVKSL